jgi:hypothetical protein
LTAVVLLASWIWISRGLDWLRVTDQLAHDRPALIEAGFRARPFFASGWTETGVRGSSPAFDLTGTEGVIRIPRPFDQGALIVLRLGATQHRGTTRVLIGGVQMAALDGPRGPGELAAFEVGPRSSGSTADLELRLETPASSEDSPALTILWIRVEPVSTLP